MKLVREHFNHGSELKGKYRRIEALQFTFDIDKKDLDLVFLEVYSESLNVKLQCDNINFYLKYDAVKKVYTVTFKLVNQYHVWKMCDVIDVADDIAAKFRGREIEKEVYYMEG